LPLEEVTRLPNALATKKRISSAFSFPIPTEQMGKNTYHFSNASVNFFPLDGSLVDVNSVIVEEDR
jgi:hypothetical protein